MASSPSNIIPFPTPPLPVIEKTPELAILLSIYCALTAQQQEDVKFNLCLLKDQGSLSARSAHSLICKRS